MTHSHDTGHENETQWLWEAASLQHRNFFDAFHHHNLQEHYDEMGGRENAVERFKKMKIVCIDERIDESDAEAICLRDGGGILRDPLEQAKESFISRQHTAYINTYGEDAAKKFDAEIRLQLEKIVKVTEIIEPGMTETAENLDEEEETA